MDEVNGIENYLNPEMLQYLTQTISQNANEIKLSLQYLVENPETLNQLVEEFGGGLYSILGGHVEYIGGNGDTTPVTNNRLIEGQGGNGETTISWESVSRWGLVSIAIIYVIYQYNTIRKAYDTFQVNKKDAKDEKGKQ